MTEKISKNNNEGTEQKLTKELSELKETAKTIEENLHTKEAELEKAKNELKNKKPAEIKIEKDLISLKTINGDRKINIGSEFSKGNKNYKIEKTKTIKDGKVLILAKNILDKKDEIKITPEEFEKDFNIGKISLPVSKERENELTKSLKIPEKVIEKKETSEINKTPLEMEKLKKDLADAEKSRNEKKVLEIEQRIRDLEKKTKGITEQPKISGIDRKTTGKIIKELRDKIPETKLNDAREKYAEGYKKFMKEDRSRWTKTIAKIFGSKIKKEDLPQELKNLEKDYNKATVEYGQKLYTDKKTELLKEKLSEENLKAELEKFKQKELFNKIIIDEAQKLINLKVENLPPKEKNLFKKTLDWYIKQNRFTKVAISVALTSTVIAAFSSGTIVAAGGLATYAGTKYIRGLIGGTVGTAATKLYDVIFKDKTKIKREEETQELGQKFNSEEISLEELISKKEEYATILEREQKRKRNRVIAKAGVALGFGGAASFGTSYGLHNLASEQAFSGHGISPQPTETEIPRGTISHENLFKPVQVELSSRGSIQTIADLKEKISQDYHGDFSKAPTNIQEFMKTDNTQEAIKLGFYDPNSPNESAMGLKGSTLGFDKNGNLISHDIKTGKESILINEKGNIEKYNGPMADTDHSGQHTNQLDQTGNKHISASKQVNPITHEPMENGHKAVTQIDPTTGKPMDTNSVMADENIRHETPINEQEVKQARIERDETNPRVNTAENTNSNIATDNVNKDQTINNQQTGEQITTKQEINIPTDNNPYFLNQEQLTQVHQTYENNVDKMFPVSEYQWDLIKSATITDEPNVSWAQKLVGWNEADASDLFKPLINHLHKLQEITGLKPYGVTILSPIPETPEEFEIRCLQKATEMGVLDQVKL